MNELFSSFIYFFFMACHNFISKIFTKNLGKPQNTEEQKQWEFSSDQPKVFFYKIMPKKLVCKWLRNGPPNWAELEFQDYLRLELMY